MRWLRKLHWQILVGLGLGVVYGIFASQMGWGGFTEAWIAPWGRIFINLLKFVAIPLVLTSLVSGVASLSDLKKLSRMGGKTIGLYMVTTTIAVLIGLLVVNVLQPGAQVPDSMREQLQAAYQPDAAARELAADKARQRGPMQFLVDMVPENFFGSASSNQNMLQVVFVSLVFGLALVQMPREKSAPVLAVVDGLMEMVIGLVQLVMRLAPLGVFALLADTITSLTRDDPGRIIGLVGALGYYCMAVVVGLGIQTLVVYPAVLKIFTPMPILKFFSGIGPAQLVGFSTSSSGATLPVTMERCKKNLGVSEETSSFVLPLGATINMDGTALYQAVAAVFIAQTLGMGLTLGMQATIVLTAVLASIGTAAVPGAGVIMLVIILEAINVPSAGIALILGVDRILDMLRTVTNVTGDAVVATTVAASENQLNIPTANAA